MEVADPRRAASGWQEIYQRSIIAQNDDLIKGGIMAL